VNSLGPTADVSIVPKIIIPLPDGAKFESVGAPVNLRIRDEFLDIIPKS
jgi:hypothetical protein